MRLKGGWGHPKVWKYCGVEPGILVERYDEKDLAAN